jgi:hypothetical protein
VERQNDRKKNNKQGKNNMPPDLQSRGKHFQNKGENFYYGIYPELTNPFLTTLFLNTTAM